MLIKSAYSMLFIFVQRTSEGLAFGLTDNASRPTGLQKYKKTSVWQNLFLLPDEFLQSCEGSLTIQGKGRKRFAGLWGRSKAFSVLLPQRNRMALLHAFEKSGNKLFRYRGLLPLILLIPLPLVVWFTDYSFLSDIAVGSLGVLALLLSLAGFMIRAITIATTPKGTSGRNTSHQVAETLNQKGIYSVVRHPLYLGNYLMWAGITLFVYNLYFFIIVSLLFWLYYERIMVAEEKFLERKFGQDFLDWSSRVPAFLPALHLYQRGGMPFSLKAVLRREYSGVLATVVCFALIDYLRLTFSGEPVLQFRPSAVVLAATAILAVLLRSLKHHTTWLNEEGRS